MEEWQRKRLDEVYAKWEKRGRGGPSRTSDPTARQLSSLSQQFSSPTPRVTRRSLTHHRRRPGKFTPDIVLTPLASFVPSLGVDVSALHAANAKKYTGISRCCQTCVPNSKIKFFPEENGGAGLQNMLALDRRKYSGFPGRFFPCLSHIYNLDASYSMPDLRRETLQAKRVREAVEFCARAAVENSKDSPEPVLYENALAEQERRAHSIVYGMSAGVYTKLLRLAGFVLFWVFGRLFNRVCVQKRHIAMLKQAKEHGVPLVFLPSHKSHMDYIIMSAILFNIEVPVPRIAAGDNLKLHLVSWIVTRLGGFFIKRRLDSSSGKDVLYRKCLHEYMVQVLHAGDNMEFFIEGSRSRSGKPGIPKAGLLSVLVDSVKEGVVEDLLIVPVSISYDKLLERSFVRHELTGGSKKKESFLDAVQGAWALLTQKIGSVRVDFAQPFSLQEYLSSGGISEHSLLKLSNISPTNSTANLKEDSQRKLVTALSHHIVYDFTRCSSLMSTNMVAFLLLIKHREGVTCSELTASYHWLEQMAANRGRMVAFTGEASEAVQYALHYLGPLVEVQPCGGESGSGRNGMVGEKHVLRPVLQLPDVFDLLHHANQVKPLFALEAVIACSIDSLVGTDLKGREGGGASNPTTVTISKEELLEEAVFLCQLLAREFIFVPPCVDLWSAAMEAVESFINSELLKMPESSIRNSGRKLPQVVQDSDEEEEGGASVLLQVSSTRQALEHLTFLQRILDPFLEAYGMTAATLLQLPDNHEVEEPEFLKQLHQNLVEKAGKGLLNRVESCSVDTLRNAVKTFADMEVLTHSNGNVLQVTDADKLLEITESISDFKS